ncbi:HNH endonuclease [Sinorhizobium meliloti]|uniref:HNH endonuclease n=1 Tax=Rhizobium meliloti TaxID=382 RepID=UPI000FDB3EF6|nr:HNH endonuclease [Sinorhizobium meliloti]RVI91814.1 hypothetical protein CN190_03470 [Sinorhizobium meliloti]
MATAKELASGLTREDLLRLLSYDRETGDLVWRVTGHAGNPTSGARAGSLHKDGYTYIKIGRERFAAHRLIWKMVTGEWPEHFIDHADRARSNNRWGNLREATKSQNCSNRTRAAGRGGMIGVWHNPKTGQWVGTLRRRQAAFSSEEEATAWRLEQERIHYGEFAPNRGIAA